MVSNKKVMKMKFRWQDVSAGIGIICGIIMMVLDSSTSADRLGGAALIICLLCLKDDDIGNHRLVLGFASFGAMIVLWYG